ncbi:MAG: polysaccharide deacetylase family protein [Eubacteriales bacterium]|nr:polysaccharide deacetylase family protein [Eubacteriales bacterium]
MRRILLIVLAAWVLFSASALAEIEQNEPPYPEALQIEVESQKWERPGEKPVEADVPVTCNAEVNQRLAASCKRLYAEMLESAAPENRIDMISTFRASGTSWAGFLLTGRVVSLTDSQHKTFVLEDTVCFDYEAITYDLATGKELTLGDVFPEGAPVWEKVCAIAQNTLGRYYESEIRDEAQLQAFTTPEALAKRPFLPSAGQLSVPIALWELLPTHRQIIYVVLPYPDFRASMTEAARAQTDNSFRPIIALTMDDGPMNVTTGSILRSLARYGASATFFSLGRCITKWPDLLRREMDFGHTVASHSMDHRSPGREGSVKLLADREAVIAQHQAVTGVAPTLFRAPGGAYTFYVKYSVGWPMIQWSESARDTGSYTERGISRHVNYAARNGDIILMHDVHKTTAKAVPLFLERLRKRGFMFATVEELMYLNGVTPKANQVYYDGFGSPVKPAMR